MDLKNVMLTFKFVLLLHYGSQMNRTETLRNNFIETTFEIKNLKEIHIVKILKSLFKVYSKVNI